MARKGKVLAYAELEHGDRNQEPSASATADGKMNEHEDDPGHVVKTT